MIAIPKKTIKLLPVVIEFDKIQDFRDQSLKESKGGYLSDVVDYDQKLQQIVDGLIGNNKFLTEFDFIQRKIVNKVNIYNCLGYKDDEFTILGINNDLKAAHPIVYDQDIKHKIRYDNITYGLITKKYIFKSLRDYYKLSFRVKHKNGKLLKVERSTYLFRIHTLGQPISQISIWEVSENASPLVVPSYYVTNYEDIMRDFYKLNSEELKLKFTPKEKEILKLKNRQFNNKEIADLLDSSSIRTIEKHIENIIKKTKLSFLERGETIQFNSIREVLHQAKIYGLFPFY